MAWEELRNETPRARTRGKLRASIRNALELAHFDRKAAEYAAPFDVVDRGPHHKLRRYSGAPEDAPVALLIPPLMMTANVYDIAPDISGVVALLRNGISPWVVDFGAPEREKGGLERTLADHIHAVAQCVARASVLTGKRVHLCGYCQGGMFAYQTAAYLRCEGVASIVTFASPVDIHKGSPIMRGGLARVLHRTLIPITKTVLSRVEAIPGAVARMGFRLATPRKNVRERINFIRSLHDREQTMRRAARRRFLGGAGFVAWPGPAFRTVIEDFMVHNRMLAGGIVIDDRIISLADITCPILAFVGMTDEIARPAAVAAIVDAAPQADVRLEPRSAGHLGIIVGSRAKNATWPTVATWISAIDSGKSANDALPKRFVPASIRERRDKKVHTLGEIASVATRDLCHLVADKLARPSAMFGAVRSQERRLRHLARMGPHTRISSSRELALRAEETPNATFLIWRGRALSYGEANTRVTNVVRGLHARGIRRGDRVGVLMGSRPSLVAATTALTRLGAVAVVAPPRAPSDALVQSFDDLGVRHVVVDPERSRSDAGRGRAVLILGGGDRQGRRRHHVMDDVTRATTDLETVDPSAIVLPSHLELDPGRARDVALIVLRPTEDDTGLRSVLVTNYRWALSALGAAAACAVTRADTIMCGVPLHHPTGLLASVGAALVGGARLALFEAQETGRPIHARRFLLEIRRVGATVVFYAGEMLRPLADCPPSPSDRHLPVRMFAGSGMRPALATRIRARFGVDTMEFYSGTSHRAIVADPTGKEPGSLGGVLPGSAPVALVKCDLVRRTHLLDPQGHLVMAGPNEPALLAVSVSEEEIPTLGRDRILVRDAFGEGSSWLVTTDVLERDSAGRHWFVDSLSGFVTTKTGEPVSTRRIEDALYTLPEVRLAAAWRVPDSMGEVAAAFSSSKEIPLQRIRRAMATLPAHARPGVIARVTDLPLTDGFRPNKRLARDRAFTSTELWRLVDGDYAPMTHPASQAPPADTPRPEDNSSTPSRHSPHPHYA